MADQSHDKIRKMIGPPAGRPAAIILRHYADQLQGIADCWIDQMQSINTALGRMRYVLINLRKMMTEKADRIIISPHIQ